MDPPSFSWLPGYGIFGSHTPVFWLNFLLGGMLGYFATRIRALGTRFEGNRWVLVLGAVAGLVGGTTLFAFWGLVVALMVLFTGRMGITELALFSLLSQIVVFVIFVLRRDFLS